MVSTGRSRCGHNKNGTFVKLFLPPFFLIMKVSLRTSERIVSLVRRNLSVSLEQSLL